MARAGHNGETSRVHELFSFPNPVNEVSARLVAGGVVLMVVLTIALRPGWATVVIAYGFVARVLTGPTMSPLGQVVTRVVTPRLRSAPRPVAGPPKRFAQGMGVAFSVTALVLTALGYWTVAEAVLALLGGGGVPRVGLRHLPRVHDIRRCSCGPVWCPKKCVSVATTSGRRARCRTWPERRRGGPRSVSRRRRGRRGCSCRRACPGSPG